MPAVCFYFQVHQPYRLRDYGVFDVGRRSNYFDAQLDEAVMRKVAAKCYRPMNSLVEELVARTDGRFRASYSITGTALEQMERWAPDVIESFLRLAKTGAIEFLAETYHHSLSFVGARDEFDEQVELHSAKIEALLGVRPRVFRNDPSALGMGSPCGSTSGNPKHSSMRSTSRSLTACSMFSASACTSSQLRPSVSTRNSSISRWRRRTRMASAWPAGVRDTPPYGV